MRFLEIACFNKESALAAATAGADRIELCDSAQVGGLTPSYSTVRKVRSKTSIPIYTMVRPSALNFVYDDIDFEEMKEDIAQFRHEGVVDGFVFGILDAAGRVDVARTTELVALARPLPCTFHRAFDQTPDLVQALEDVVACGMASVLTSGGKGSAAEGAEVLEQLVKCARGRIVIMPGGGVRSSNIDSLVKTTGAEWFHSSALLGDESVASQEEIRALKLAISKDAADST